MTRFRHRRCPAENPGGKNEAVNIYKAISSRWKYYN
jgi:hypothetical protein